MILRVLLSVISVLITASYAFAFSEAVGAEECVSSAFESGSKLLQTCKEGTGSAMLPMDRLKKEAPYDISLVDASAVTVPPEITTMVELSSSDVNRFICPEGMDARDATGTDIIFSKEKGVTTKILGRNVFVKFKIQRIGQQEIYSQTPTEMYIVCGDTVYSIIAIPKRLPSKTIMLTANNQKAKKNIALYKDIPFEKKIVSILKSAYKNDASDTFTIVPVKKEIKVFKDISLVHERNLLIEGEGLRVKEIFISTNKDKIDFKEKDFLKTEITTRPVAIALEKLSVKKGETIRLFIVEQAGGENASR